MIFNIIPVAKTISALELPLIFSNAPIIIAKKAVIRVRKNNLFLLFIIN